MILKPICEPNMIQICWPIRAQAKRYKNIQFWQLVQSWKIKNIWFINQGFNLQCTWVWVQILTYTDSLIWKQAKHNLGDEKKLQKRPYQIQEISRKVKTCSCNLGQFKVPYPSKHIAGSTRSDLQSNSSTKAQGITRYHLTVCTYNSKLYLLIHTHLTCFCDWFVLLEIIRS